MGSKIRHVVILDDNIIKQDKISEYIRELIPEAEILVFGYINSALAFISWHSDDINNNPSGWLVIIDMVLPRLSDSRPVLCGGEGVLFWLNRRGFECPAILESSEQVDSKKLKDCYPYLLGTVLELYNVSNLEVYKQLLTNYL